MRTRADSPWIASAGLAMLLTAAALPDLAAGMPIAESFESYADGYAITNVPGWSAEGTGGGVVTTNAEALVALAAFTNAGSTFPLSEATHAKVLAISGQLNNAVTSPPGRTVIAEFMVLATQRADPPEGNTNHQVAFYIDTNSQFVIWHQDRTGAATNTWLTLDSGPGVTSGTWARVTIREDFVHGMFQIGVNQGAPITHAAGWTGAGGSQPGSWYYMVKTNAEALARFRAEDAETSYLDDLVFTNRSLSCSGSAFNEAPANDGTMANGLSLTVHGDTFVSNATYAVGTHFAVSGLPVGLACHLDYESPTQLTASLTGRAALHFAAGTTNMTLALLDAVFSQGMAADVTGNSIDGIAIQFADPPVLAWTGGPFSEAGLNDGSISNSTDIALVGDTFTNTASLVEHVHYTVSGVPAGMTFTLTRRDASHLAAELSGSASAHGTTNDATLTVALLDAAFDHVAASNIIGTQTNLAVRFKDTPELLYSTTGYAEAAANNGAVMGGTIRLVTETFTGADGDDFVTLNGILVTGLPAGLTAVVTRTGAQLLTVRFDGNALAHANSNDVHALGFAFQNTAFEGGSAAEVLGASRTDLSIDFDDPPVVTCPGNTFHEVPLNNGSVTGTVTFALAGDTFVEGPLSAGTHYDVSGVPPGLTFELVRTSATQLMARLNGNAPLPHGSAQSATLALTFSNAAFSTVGAADVSGSTPSLHVVFDDAPTLTYSRADFFELSYGLMDNTLPIVIALSDDTFAPGSDFVSEGKILAAGLPEGLTAVVSRISDHELSLTLVGAAVNNSPAANASFTLTFQNGAFGATQADQVTGYQQSVNLTFNDRTLTINTVPYAESFEHYPDGFLIAGTNGWQSQAADGGTVTSEAAVVSALSGYGPGVPVSGAHDKVLRVTDELSNEILSAPRTTVFTDFMLYPTARTEAPEGSTNYQVAFYVNTNQQLVAWHRNTTGTPTNEWRVLGDVPAVATGTWHRVTIEQDFAHGRFRLYLDRGLPLRDEAGWSLPVGGTPSGAWFTMVNTNGYLSRFRVQGAAADSVAYVDDLTVSTQPLDFIAPLTGSVFVFH